MTLEYFTLVALARRSRFVVSLNRQTNDYYFELNTAPVFASNRISKSFEKTVKMFYNEAILCMQKKGKFALVWIAATRGTRSITHTQILEIDLEKIG